MVAFFIVFFLFAASVQSAEWKTEEWKDQKPGQPIKDNRILFDDPFDRSDEARIPLYEPKEKETSCPRCNAWCSKEVNCSYCPRYSRSCYVGLCSAFFSIAGLAVLGVYFANKLPVCNDNKSDC
jgi:hypothetical protein